MLLALGLFIIRNSESVINVGKRNSEGTLNDYFSSPQFSIELHLAHNALHQIRRPFNIRRNHKRDERTLNSRDRPLVVGTVPTPVQLEFKLISVAFRGGGESSYTKSPIYFVLLELMNIIQMGRRRPQNGFNLLTPPRGDAPIARQNPEIKISRCKR